MNSTVSLSSEVEVARQEYLEELKADSRHLPDQFAPGSLGCHELLDRTSVVMDSLERFILSHPSCVQNKQWFSLAYQATAALNELYQQVGAEHL